MKKTHGTLHLALALLAAAPTTLIACDSTVGGNGNAVTPGDDTGSGTGTGSGSGGAGGGDVTPEPIDAVDVLLVVDGSGSMADKQGFLAESFLPFLERLHSPRCVDGSGEAVAKQPAQGAPCPAGSAREYSADVTVHVGVVSSNLGASSSLCESDDPARTDDDRAHLVARDPAGGLLPTYAGMGFFAWDPAQLLSPAGESDFGTFAALVQQAIQGVGEMGCGFEQPLEAMVRFLAQPDAVDSQGNLDEVLRDQRDAFLRPESVVSVILLSDENDASMQPGRAELFAAQQSPMPRPRAECAIDPTDACCVSCIEAVPSGCSGDGGCAAPGDPANPANFYAVDHEESNIFLRLWETKRRFGIEALHPVQRYVDALSSPTLIDVDGDEEQNPLFEGGRDPSRVLFTAIVGVPWQLVARDPGAIEEGFQSSDEMLQNGTWDVVLGDPERYVRATDPHMIESPHPRGSLPIAVTGDEDPISGGERDTEYTDLQYACVFDLPEQDQLDCATTTETSACDCRAGVENPALCAPGSEGDSLQVRAKAYPGLRQLDLAKRLGSRARVVPMCSLLLEPGETPDPGSLGTLGLRIGLGDAAEDVADLLGP